jgi:phage tail sheath protein FI
VNVIRAFTGRGTKVWGARTLAGNDNEYRYVPVRRLMLMIEESIEKATNQFVFSPNDRTTWVRIQTMIENFLFTQWRVGALQGEKPEHAYKVLVGLGVTMTADDILNGILRLVVRVAPVRPAEFIEITFEQTLPSS